MEYSRPDRNTLWVSACNKYEYMTTCISNDSNACLLIGDDERRIINDGVRTWLVSGEDAVNVRTL